MMWSSYQEMYLNNKNEKLIMDERLEMVRFVHEIGNNLLLDCFNVLKM